MPIQSANLVKEIAFAPCVRGGQEEALDDALKNTFPASDPVSIEQATSPAADDD
jgi:hypothetical protein